MREQWHFMKILLDSGNYHHIFMPIPARLAQLGGFSGL
jgi:hypothetical protein